jgi:hypothetical protein
MCEWDKAGVATKNKDATFVRIPFDQKIGGVFL